MAAAPFRWLRDRTCSLIRLSHGSGMRKSSSTCSAGGLSNNEVMSPELWGTLPDDLIDVIIHKILVDLPFARHWSFCRASKKWKDFLLSNQYIVYCHTSIGICKIFDMRRDKWESMSLKFGLVERNRLQYDLELVSADGGLLTFVNRLSDRLLVWNPLTRRCAYLARSDRRWNLRTSSISYTVARNSELSGSLAGSLGPNSSPFSMLKICITGNNMAFRISARCFVNGGVVVLDSRNSRGWERRASFNQKDFWFILNGSILQSPEGLILGFATDNEGSNVLVYDVRLEVCRWTTTQTLLDAMINSTGKALAICSDSETRMTFFEVHGTGLEMTLVESPSPTLPPSLHSVSENMRLTIPHDLNCWHHKRLYLSLVCSATGDVVHFIGELRGASVTPFNSVSAVLVQTDAQQRSGHKTSNWTILGPQPGFRPCVDCKRFNPSEAGPQHSS